MTVRVRQHEFLHREADDLHCRLGVSITQAALGGELVACGLLEDARVTVPAGSQPGDVIKVKGSGMPRMNGHGTGDLYVHLGVDVPKKLTKRQRELLTELSAELGDAKHSERTPLQRLKEWLGG